MFKENSSADLTAPPSRAFAITPNDSADLSEYTRAICVKGAGDVRVTTTGNTTETIYVAAGVPFPLRVKRVLATSTTATGIVGLV